MAKSVTVWFDSEADFLDVKFSDGTTHRSIRDTSPIFPT